MAEVSLARIESSNLPAAQKSNLRRWVERVQGNGIMARAEKHLGAGAHAVRQGGESVIVGAALGAIEGQHGTLDISLSKTKPQMVLPADAAVGAVGLIAGVLFAHEEYGTDLRNAGAAGAAIFSYRKTREFVAARKTKTTATAHGDDVGFGAEEDPILAAARAL
jgi:hypothetical protein